MQSEFILESERESFIEQVREVIEMADNKGEGMKEGYTQVHTHTHAEREREGYTQVHMHTYIHTHTSQTA